MPTIAGLDAKFAGSLTAYQFVNAGELDPYRALRRAQTVVAAR